MLAEIDDEDFAKQLMKEFEKEFWEAMANIRSGIEKEDLESTKVAAHSIKGSAAVFGADGLSYAAKELEALVKNGSTDKEALSALADEIERAFATVDKQTLAQALA
mmetsp:Transcript_70/g.97  ORF Transcript_70/g.97 Transcript_70/m.97 type:complete len:106 (-) Transcript_70:97-414(-)